VYPSFGLLRTIHYFIIFCKIAETSTAYAESSFLAGLTPTPTPTPGFKKIGTPTPTPALGYNPDSGDSDSDSAPLMKTPLGTEVDLGSGHIVLDGVPALRKRGTAAPLFSAHVYCGHGRPSQLLLSSC